MKYLFSGSEKTCARLLGGLIFFKAPGSTSGISIKKQYSEFLLYENKLFDKLKSIHAVEIKKNVEREMYYLYANIW